MCNRAILENGEMLGSVPSRYKTQEMCIRAVNSLFPIVCDKTVDENSNALDLGLIDIKLKKCLIKLLVNILLH